MADPIELGSTAYSLHPDQRRRRARRGLFTPDHPFTRHDDRTPEQEDTPPPPGILRLLLSGLASGLVGMRPRRRAAPP